MSNKETMKRIFENEFDIKKNYNQILNKIERKNYMKINKILQYSLVPICLLLVVGSIILFNNKPNNILTTVNGNGIIINQRNYKENAYSLDADVKIIKNDNILEMYLINNQFDVPNGLALEDSYCIYVKDYDGNSKEEYAKIKEYTKLSGCNLIYSNEGKKIKIALAKGHIPLRDYFFEDDSLKISKINNVEVTIVKYKNNYWATFNKNDIYYDIETKDVNINELVNLITPLIKE